MNESSGGQFVNPWSQEPPPRTRTTEESASKFNSESDPVILSLSQIRNMICGGTSDLKPATDEVQELCAQVKQDAEKKVGRPFPEFTAKTFKSQVVAGINYFVKVHVGEGKYIHLRIYKNIQQEVILHGLQENKTETEDIAYFQ